MRFFSGATLLALSGLLSLSLPSASATPSATVGGSAPVDNLDARTFGGRRLGDCGAGQIWGPPLVRKPVCASIDVGMHFGWSVVNMIPGIDRGDIDISICICIDGKGNLGSYGGSSAALFRLYKVQQWSGLCGKGVSFRDWLKAIIVAKSSGSSVCPSKRARYRRSLLAPRDDEDMCGGWMETCPFGAYEGFECLDTTKTVDSCGGCTSRDEGEDCTAIPNALNTSCSDGKCKVESCEDGYVVGADSNTCEPVDHTAYSL